MNSLTQAELLVKLEAEREELLVTIEMVSPAKLKKTGNPYNDHSIFKHTTLEGAIGKRYSDEMRDYVKEGEEEYTPKPRAWGKLINPYVIEHKGGYYLQVFVTSALPSQYIMDGDVLLNEEGLKEWLPSKSSSDIMIRDIKFENIKKVTFKQVTFKQEYEIV